MDPNQETDNSDYFFELSDDETVDESSSVDDFIKELEAKEKDLHITADTTFIEIAADFEDGELPDFLKPDLPESGQKNLHPAVAPTGAADRAIVANLEKELVTLKKKISAFEAERKDLLEKSQRRSRDFDAYKARTERERGFTFQKQLSNLATQMLPALDNLDRALKFASEMPEEQRDSIEQFFDGIFIVNQQVNEVLAGMGIMPIATVGQPFDPHYHEAVAIDEKGNFPPNTISEELLRGFRIGDDVIRHSMVKVSKASQENQPPEAAIDDSEPKVFYSDADGYQDPVDDRESDVSPANHEDDK
ncbi:MAG: nucleotide exchange factor GrpE [Pyrinomonadaceae bacterium]